MLLRRVVSTPGGQKKSYLCLYLSLLYLVPVVNAPAPLGSPNPRLAAASRHPSCHTSIAVNRFAHAVIANDFTRSTNGRRRRGSTRCRYLTIIIPSCKVRLGS